MDEADRLITVGAAAALLHMNPQAVRRRITAGTLKAINRHPGGKRRSLRLAYDDVIAYRDQIYGSDG